MSRGGKGRWDLEEKKGVKKNLDNINEQYVK
jgi:hypothetical protein